MLQYFNPLAWGRWMGQFVSAWLMSVPWGHAPKAIPAIILMLVLIVTATVALTNTSNWRTDLLNRQLQQALEIDDFETAELLLERQLGRRPNDSEIAYRLAISRDAQGKSAEATELMTNLVQHKRFEPAGRWLLQKQYLDKPKNRKLSQQQQDEYGRLLRLIHEESPEDNKIKVLLTRYFISMQKYPQAVPLLDDLSALDPMFGLQAAILERNLGNETSAQRYANETLARVSQMHEEDPTNSKLAISVVQNQLFLHRYSEAVRTLNLAIRRARSQQDRSRLSQAMGEAIVVWVGSIENTTEMQSSADRLRVLKMLQTALTYAPENHRVLMLVCDHVLATVDENEEQIAAVRDALISGSSAGIAHFIRGTSALVKDDVETATVSLELAAQHMPHSGAILNNLAVALSMRGEEHLEKALKISQESMKRTRRPTPYFYDTRGQILYRMGHYLEAIPDLERALQTPAIAPEAHRSLAVCYEKIGQAELGRLHREAAGDQASDETPE